MNSYGILDFHITNDIEESKNLEKTLYDILDTLECMQVNGTCLFYADVLYDQSIFEKHFSDWLYDLNSQPELSTFKKELSKRIHRCSVMNTEDHNRFINNIDNEICEDILAMVVSCSNKSILYVATPTRYWQAKQWYLSTYTKRHDFASDIKDCFPNLYFHKNVDSSLHTLNADFIIERPHIVEHLRALNDFSPRFTELNAEGSDYRRTCSEFQAHSHIECSPQSNRSSARKLNFSFITCTGDEVIICCELHTKLKWNGMDREHQDRIYFHPGKTEVAEGKVLIAHIGSHI